MQEPVSAATEHVDETEVRAAGDEDHREDMAAKDYHGADRGWNKTPSADSTQNVL